MDEVFMRRCLDLARSGLGLAAPNPMVGCVIVHEGIVIGEGYHERFGAAHAEVNAIESVSDDSLLPKSTLYVNLEPCTHIGKTPACADLIVKSNISRVVIGSRDINDQVSGQGVEYLKQHKIQVETGLLEEECKSINKRFYKFHVEQRPYIILKWAQSKDSFIAPSNEEQRWITGEEAKKLVHKWRTEEQAIMVGTNTVIIDNPSLTARQWEGKNPTRITIDNGQRISSTSNILNGDASTIIYSSQNESGQDNVEYVTVPSGPKQLNDILADLHKREVLSVIVEGGQKLLNSFISLDLWDEARVFTGQAEFKNGLEAPNLNIKPSDEEHLGSDILRLYFKED